MSSFFEESSKEAIERMFAAADDNFIIRQKSIDLVVQNKIIPESIKAKQRSRANAYTARMKSRGPAGYLLKRIIRRALHKDMVCTLTIDDCGSLGGCYYCGDDASGFDRVDSNGGYTKDNVVPACATCNSMKMSMPQSVFIDQCKHVASRF